MGVVFAATHLTNLTTVAVKLLRREQVDDPRAASRLLREARIVATLRSEHVARVLDVGTHDGLPYVVMELLEGRTVHNLISTEGRLPLSRAVDLLIQACHGLADAHSQGIVHRDVKPSNLLLRQREDGDSELKVIDFGISKTLNVEAGSVETQTGTLLGSPPFMSPEQLHSSRRVDARSDVWSLGVVLHYMLTGERPFEGASLLELMTKIVHEPAPTPDGVPSEIAVVLSRCLAKSAADRFASTAELAQALSPFASARGRALAAQVCAAPLVAAESPSSNEIPLWVDVDVDTLTHKDESVTSHAGTVRTTTTETTPRGTRRGVFGLVGVAGFVAIAALLIVRSNRATVDVHPQSLAEETASAAVTTIATFERPPLKPSVTDSTASAALVSSAPPTKAGRRPPPTRVMRTGAKSETSAHEQPPKSSTRPDLPKTPD